MDYRQSANKIKYDFAASTYDTIAYILSLGQANKIYQKIASKIDHNTCENIVELGCGPASVIPYIVEHVDKSSHITGIDFSTKMIEIADRKKESNNWYNVEFKCMDMYEYQEIETADTVIFCLALTAIPNATRALEKALSILKPGGKIIIIDSLPLNSKWWHPLTNTYIYLKSLLVGAKPTKEILTFINKKMVDIQSEEMLCGIYTLITARRP